MDLVTTRRGDFDKMDYLDEQRVLLTYRMPLGELIVDFYDQLKSRTQGYASLDYSFAEYAPADLVKLDVLVNAQSGGRALDDHAPRRRLRAGPRAGRDAAQADPAPDVRRADPGAHRHAGSSPARRSRRCARTSLAKCYGGDITRKRKLLEKQKEGKARMKMVGSVEIPQEAFMAVLSLDRDLETAGR